MATDYLTGAQTQLKSALYVFPQELRNTSNNWSFMSFCATDSVAIGATSSTVFLPVPQNLVFDGTAKYEDIELGALGLTGGTSAAPGDLPTSGVAVGAIAAAVKYTYSAVPGASEKIDYGSKTVANKNTRTAFKGVDTRKFTFSFKMIGRSVEDSKVIKDINDLFQEKMYPEGNGVILAYPPIWRLQFFNGDGNRNDKIPGISESYLINVSSTYNSSTNIFHEDGSPFEVDMQLQFEETRPLRRSDIIRLRDTGINNT